MEVQIIKKFNDNSGTNLRTHVFCKHFACLEIPVTPMTDALINMFTWLILFHDQLI